MFNNRLEAQNLLSSSYLSGNILFNKDTLFSPVLNYIKCTDLALNTTYILPMQTHNHIRNISIHPEGVIIVAIDVAGYAVVFNLKGMFVVAEFNFKGAVSSAGFSADGKLFYVAQKHGFMVYECPSFWRTLQPFLLLKKYKNRHSSDITNCTFSPDSRFLLTCGSDNQIYLNNLFPIKDYIAFTFQVHKYKILGASFSTSMEYLYTIDSGSNVYVWKWVEELTEGYVNFREGRKRARQNGRNAGKGRKDVKQQTAAEDLEIQEEQKQENNQNLSAFQKKVNSGRYILSKKIIVTEPGAYLKRFSYSPETGFLALGYSNGKFSIQKLHKQQLTPVQTFSIGTYKISSICVNQSCTWIGLAVKQLGQVIVWEWKSQSYILSQKGLIFDSTSVASFSTSKYIATCTKEGEVKLFQKQSGMSITTFREHNASVTDIKFSNATTLFSSSLDGSVHAYDCVKYRKFRTFRPDVTCQLQCLQLDEAGEIVFAGAFEPYEIYGWNVQTGNIIQIIRGHQGPISSLKLSGEYLISGSWDKTLKIHQIYARKLNVETLEHSSQITAVAFHSEGKTFAAATIRGQIYIWEAEKCELVGIIDSQVSGGRSYFSKISAQNDSNTKYLKTITYSNCGKYLIGGGKSKYIYIYDVTQKILLQKVELTKNRDLQGVVEKLNSKFVKEGQDTYEMVLEEQERGMDDEQDRRNQNILPGSRKIDISQIRTKLQVDVHKIVILDNHSLAVCTSFGVFVYSSASRSKFIFNPYDLDPLLTPSTVVNMLKNKEYSSAVSGALKLNMPINKLVNKIPVQNIKQTVSEIDVERLNIFLIKMSEKSLNYRECLWANEIIKVQGIKIPNNLLLSLQNLVNSLSLMKGIEAKLQISQIMSI